MAFGVPHTQACSVLPHQRRPPSLHSRADDRIQNMYAHALPRLLSTQPARAVPTDRRHVHPALSSPQADGRHAWRETSAWLRCAPYSASASAGAGALGGAVAAENQVDIRSAVCCCLGKNPANSDLRNRGICRPSPIFSVIQGCLPTETTRQCVCREQSFVSAVGAQCLQTVRLTAVPCPPFPGALRRFLQTIRDPCPPANAETPDQDPRRLIPRSIIISPSSHLRLSPPSFHRLSAAALPPGRISPSRPTDLLFAHTTPAS